MEAVSGYSEAASVGRWIDCGSGGSSIQCFSFGSVGNLCFGSVYCSGESLVI